MTSRRSQIIDAFEDLRSLLCESGMFAKGNPVMGTWVLYWGNGLVRSLVSFRDGCRHGLSANFYTSGQVSSFCFYRHGSKWGETGVMNKEGVFLKRLFIGEDGDLDYNDETKNQFIGYYLINEVYLIQWKYRIQWGKLT
jgi:antitoxin component YwqK of YwqJK toxin-antitoxin module